MGLLDMVESVASDALELPRESVNLAGDVAAKAISEASEMPSAILDAGDKVAEAIEGGLD